MSSVSYGCSLSTLDYLEWHALRQPRRIAMRTRERVARYADLFQDVLRVAAALRPLDLPSGGIVALSHSHTYHHWLLLLACEALGIATCSCSEHEWQSLSPLHERVDAVLAARPLDGLEGRVHVLDPAWFERSLLAPASGNVERIHLSASAPARLNRSSGSTGEPKFILLDRWQIDDTIAEHVAKNGFAAGTVELCGGPVAINAVYVRVLACLRLGAQVVAMPPVEGLRAAPVTHSYMLPLAAQKLVDALPADWTKRAGMRLRIAGAPLADALRTRLLALVCDEIDTAYGTNEVGMICELDRRRGGVVAPGVDLRILDAATGREAEPGAEGDIWARSAAMIDGYYRQPQLTHGFFRDGWFATGDRGRMAGRRTLQLTGRSDEILNLGGVKCAADPIEEVFRAQNGVQDAMVLHVEVPDAQVSAAVLLVLREGASPDAVMREGLRRLPSWGALLRGVVVPALPRLDSGKLDRRTARTLAEGALRRAY